jgi:ATP-dependent DNA ligase
MKGAKNLNLTIFESNLFSGPVAKASPFIKAMHPKTNILPKPEAIVRILNLGWVGQMKVDGHRAQIHLCADPKQPVVAYNRHGEPHKKLLPASVTKELRRVFAPVSGWNVIDTEWVKPAHKLFVFDILKKDGKLLRHCNYAERHALLPREYLSPHLVTLPLLTKIERCLELLERQDPYCEGLVFKSLTTPGFLDTSIIRCRRAGSKHT